MRSRPCSSAIPDLRDTLKSATANELAEILETFEVTATYDKPNRALELAATLARRHPTHTDRQMAVGAISR